METLDGTYSEDKLAEIFTRFGAVIAVSLSHAEPELPKRKPRAMSRVVSSALKYVRASQRLAPALPTPRLRLCRPRFPTLRGAEGRQGIRCPPAPANCAKLIHGLWYAAQTHSRAVLGKCALVTFQAKSNAAHACATEDELANDGIEKCRPANPDQHSSDSQVTEFYDGHKNKVLSQRGNISLPYVYKGEGTEQEKGKHTPSKLNPNYS